MRGGAADENVERCFRAIVEAEDSILDEAAARVLTEFPIYARAPRDRFRTYMADCFRNAAAVLSERRGPSPEEFDRVATVAEKQARFGIPLDVILQASRVAIAHGADRCLEIARRYDVDPAIQLEYMELLWKWWDSQMVVTADTHRRVDLERARRDQDVRVAYVRSLLFGTLSRNELQARGATYGLAVSVKYIPFRARPGRGVSGGELAEAIETSGAENGRVALVAALDGDIAGVVGRPPEVDVDATIALGPAAELDALEPSFRQASRALDTAVAFGLRGVMRLDDLSLKPAVVSEAYLGDRLVARYLEPLAELGEFGATIEATLAGYLRLGMRVEETAKALDVHPNTLRHRLERFEETTGADLRSTQDLVELWWALQRRRVTSGQP